MARTHTLLDEALTEKLGSRRRAVDLAYDAIRAAISSGRVQPGDWLRREELAQELHMSSVVVREALSRLVGDGLAVAEPYRGVRVVKLPPEDLRDLYEMRAALEAIAMESAADRIGEEDLQRMRALVEPSAMTSDPASVSTARNANREFHWIAIRACGRRHLIQEIERLWDMINPWILGEAVSPEQREQYGQEDAQHHKEMVSALEAGDGKRARDLAAVHVRRALHDSITLKPERRVSDAEMEEEAGATEGQDRID